MNSSGIPTSISMAGKSLVVKTGATGSAKITDWVNFDCQPPSFSSTKSITRSFLTLRLELVRFPLNYIVSVS